MLRLHLLKRAFGGRQTRVAGSGAWPALALCHAANTGLLQPPAKLTFGVPHVVSPSNGKGVSLGAWLIRGNCLGWQYLYWSSFSRANVQVRNGSAYMVLFWREVLCGMPEVWGGLGHCLVLFLTRFMFPCTSLCMHLFGVGSASARAPACAWVFRERKIAA